MGVAVPDDLMEFLRVGQQLEYDAEDAPTGRITLHALGELSVGLVWINARPMRNPQGDPHAGEGGHYAIPAVNLVARTEEYSTGEYMLLWLPEEEQYGTWDCDHAELMSFPGVTWTDIAADPLEYIMAACDMSEPGVPVVPYAKYPYRSGSPL